MRVRVETRGDVEVIEVSGRIDCERTDSFHEACAKHLVQKKVIFNLKDLSFVGSTGITSFVDTLKMISQRSDLRICGASSEFQKVFQIRLANTGIHVYDELPIAIESFFRPRPVQAEFVEPAEYVPIDFTQGFSSENE